MSHFYLHLPPLADCQPALYNILMASPTTAGLAPILENETVIFIGDDNEGEEPFSLALFSQEERDLSLSNWQLPETIDDWKLLFEVPNSVILDDTGEEIDPEYLWGLISHENTVVDVVHVEN